MATAAGIWSARRTPRAGSGRSAFGRDDVITFLGRKLTGHFLGEVVADQFQAEPRGRRIPGRRVKHRVRCNWIKMYDRGPALRVETVSNHPEEFRMRNRVRRAARDVLAWVALCKSVTLLWDSREARRRGTRSLARRGQGFGGQAPSVMGTAAEVARKRFPEQAQANASLGGVHASSTDPRTGQHRGADRAVACDGSDQAHSGPNRRQRRAGLEWEAEAKERRRCESTMPTSFTASLWPGIGAWFT